MQSQSIDLDTDFTEMLLSLLVLSSVSLEWAVSVDWNDRTL
jgi:hypothetical protein